MNKRASIVRSEWMLMAMVGLLPLLWVPVGQGQTTSITSSGLNTQVSHVAGQPNYDITGGTRPGNGTNLFHSFGDFSIGANHVAQFLNDSGLATTNILSRVTGGNPSNIFGEINTTNFPGANLYLINPAGVLFGPNATLNVSGSVHVSTADYLRLADGLRFNAIPGPQDTLLSQAPVVAFGFLNAHPRPITVHGSQLAVPEGKGLSLVGGDIKVTGGTLTAPGGQINLASLAGRGEARVAPENLAIAGWTLRGQIVIKGGAQPDHVARIDTSGQGGGAVVVRGGKLSLVRAEVLTEARADNHRGGDIVIEGTKSATFDNVGLLTRAHIFLPDVPPLSLAGGAVSLTAPTMRASNLTIDTSGINGLAGDVAVTVRNLSGSSLQIVSSVSSAGGNFSSSPASGNISISATGDVALHNSRIETLTSHWMTDAGQITVRAATFMLKEGSRIGSSSEGGGSAGNIVIDVGRLTMKTANLQDLRNRPSISTFAMEAHGEGGNITVSSRNAILLEGGTISTARVGAPGGGGSITLSTPRLTLNQVGRISTGSDGARGGDISMNVRTLNLINGGGISTSTNGAGEASAGNIDIVAHHSISMAGVAVLSSGRQVPSGISMSAPSGQDKLGHLHIVSPALHLADGAGVRAFSESTHPDTGSIVLDVGELEVSRDAHIVSSNPRGDGIPIVINAVKSINLDNSTIAASGRDFGQSGNVSLHAGKSILLRNGSLISADNTSSGGEMDETFNAGHIVIQAGKSVVIRDSTVSAKAEQGNGGTIVVDAKNVTLRGSQLTTSVSGGPDTVGGRIVVDAKNVILRNSQLLSTATEGDGGTIHIRSRTFHRDATSVIDASSESGTDGTVTIESRY